MQKRLLLLIASLPLAVAISLGVLAMLPGSGVTKANFDRIERGMRLADVEKILGGKARKVGIWSAPDREEEHDWIAEDGSWASFLIHDGCVRDSLWMDSTETPLQRMLRWLHLN